MSSGSGWSLAGARKLQFHLQEESQPSSEGGSRDFNCITKQGQLSKGEIYFSSLFLLPYGKLNHPGAQQEDPPWKPGETSWRENVWKDMYLGVWAALLKLFKAEGLHQSCNHKCRKGLKTVHKMA